MPHKIGDRVLATKPYVRSTFTISPETVGIIVKVEGTLYTVFWGHPDGYAYEFLPPGVKRLLREHELGPVERTFGWEPPWMAEVEHLLRDG